MIDEMKSKLNSLLENSPLAKMDPETQLSEWVTSKVTHGAASRLNQLVQNSPFRNQLNMFSKIMNKVRISIVEEKAGVELSIFTFPITPTIIHFSGEDNEIVEVDTIAGKINYKKGINFKKIDFKSFFPANYYPFSENYNNTASQCIDIINKYKYKERPIKLVITGWNIVEVCYISSFEGNTTAEGDYEYTIEFTESRDPSIYETKSKNYSFKPTAFDLTK